MIVLAVPFAVSLIGLVVYLAASNVKAAEAGRAAFWVGLLVGLLRVGGATVSLLR
jgi:hypothetical protein